MAYFTRLTENTERTLTEAESTQLNNYIAAQVSAGTTDGNLYTWTGIPNSANFRIWSTQAAATGYQSIFQAFSPAISLSVY